MLKSKTIIKGDKKLSIWIIKNIIMDTVNYNKQTKMKNMMAIQYKKKWQKYRMKNRKVRLPHKQTGTMLV